MIVCYVRLLIIEKKQKSIPKLAKMLQKSDDLTVVP